MLHEREFANKIYETMVERNPEEESSDVSPHSPSPSPVHAGITLLLRVPLNIENRKMMETEMRLYSVESQNNEQRRVTETNQR